MAAKGSIAKEEIGQTILNTFTGSFMCPDGKTIRIPMEENGEIIEIKVALTAAKDILGQGIEVSNTDTKSAATVTTPVEDCPFDVDNITPTQEEIDAVKRMTEALAQF